MKHIKIITVAIMAFIAVALMPACRKNKGGMTVRMTDAPASYSAVNVDIQAVEVHYDDTTKGKSGWITLDTKAGIYNLLELQNNVTTTLVNNDAIAAGSITQMRLVLGSRNSVVSDGKEYEMKVPSGSESGIKINLNTLIEPGKEIDIVLDFDASASVIDLGFGGFSLKPHISVKSIIQL